MWDVTKQVRSRQEIDGLRSENSALLEASHGDLATSFIMDSIEKSERRFRSVVQTAYDAIITMDSRGLITFWNYGAETMFGYSAEEAVGMPLTMIMPERYRRTHAAGLGRVVSTGKTRVVGHRVELNGLRKGGTEFPIELSLAEWRIENELSFTGIIRDITDRKLSEAELVHVREALEQAYSREHHIADTLQRALIPEVSFMIPGYHVAAKYQPALDEAEVGGDFYDVFGLVGGKTAVVMGDVSGKGLEAAVYTAMAKYTIRAYAVQNPDPAHVLSKLNEVLYQYTPDDLFVTVFYAVLSHEGQVLTYGSAGHDPPLVYSPGSDRIAVLSPTGCVAGIMRGCQYSAGSLKLDPGDILVIYTDGVTDARSAGKLLGVDGLARVLGNCANTGGGLTDAIFEAVSEAGDGALRDDAALLIIRALEREHCHREAVTSNE